MTSTFNKRVTHVVVVNAEETLTADDETRFKQQNPKVQFVVATFLTDSLSKGSPLNALDYLPVGCAPPLRHNKSTLRCWSPPFRKGAR